MLRVKVIAMTLGREFWNLAIYLILKINQSNQARNRRTMVVLKSNGKRQ